MFITENSMASACGFGLPFSYLRCIAWKLVLVILVVEAASPLVWVSVPSNNADERINIDFYCLLTSNNSPVKVKRWEFNGKEVIASSHIRIRPAHTTHILEIISTQQSDSGTYTCIADVNGVEVTASENLKVYPAIVTYTMPVTTARVGDDVTMKCDGEHYDIIFWWRNSEMIQPGKQGFFRFRSEGEGSRLHITSVTKEDNGTYRCEFISLRTAYSTVELLVVEDVIRPSTQFVISTVATAVTASSQTSGHPTPLLITTQTPRKGKLRNRTSTNSVSSTVAITAIVSTHHGSIATVSPVSQATTPPLSVRNKTQSDSSLGAVINTTAKSVGEKDISDDTSLTAPSVCIKTRREETPTWALVVILVGALCGFSGGLVCAGFLLKHSCSGRSLKDLSNEQNGKPCTLQHGRSESDRVRGQRNVFVHLYDVVRLYETIDGEKKDDIGVCPIFRPSTSVERDSRGYALMEGCGRPTETKSVPRNPKLRSNHVTNEYMEMGVQKSDTDISDREDTLAGNRIGRRKLLLWQHGSSPGGKP